MMPIFSMFFQTQRCTLGHLELDVMLRENISFPSNVTQYPVEDGGQEISDHITQSSETLSIDGSISQSSMVAFDFSGSGSKLADAVQTLREMHEERALVEIVTGLGVYEDMAFTNLSLTRTATGDKGGNWIDINASLIKVRKVALAEAELPPDKVEAGGGTKGRTDTTNKASGQSGNQSQEPSGSQKTAAKSSLDYFKDKYKSGGLSGALG